MSTRARIDEFLSEKKIALAGASRNGKKFGNTVLNELVAGGYEVLPIHPEADEIAGIRCRRSLSDLPPDVGSLLLVVPPSETEKLVRQAAAAGIKRIWMQLGARSNDAVTFCEANGIRVVHGECILMFAEPAAWVHRFHRSLRRVFGRLPR